MSSSIYDALSIAYYIDSQDMGAKQQAAFLQRIYQEERDCLIELYRNNQRKFILDVSYWVDYLIDKVTFDKVLMIDEKIGHPYVDGAKVTAEIVKQGKQRKIRIFKYRQKTNYHRTQGHRQPYTKVVIKTIK